MTTHVTHHRVKPYRPPGLPRGVNPGGPMQQLPRINPGGPMQRIQPAKKTGHAKKAKKAKKARKWSRGVAQCCAAQALADSLEALGRPVDGDAVLDLYWRTARTADAGASILATLESAAEHGLGGHLLAGFEEISAGETLQAGLILGVDQPGPHAVFGDVPAGAVVEEAWAVTWA